jgi:hypothetical protein
MGFNGQKSKILVLKRGTFLRVGWGSGRLAFIVMRLWFKLQRVENHRSDVWQLKARITFGIVIDSYIR